MSANWNQRQPIDWTPAVAKRRKADAMRQEARELEAQAMLLHHSAHLWAKVDALRDQAELLDAQADSEQS